jgi:precorrin-2 dehydrogenase/sirohydrochlorin ferrochelatase
MNYPIMLRLVGKKVIVVGGGKVAERKVTGLLGTGALVRVISPEVTTELHRLAVAGEITWQQKTFSDNDMVGVSMIFAATNNERVNQFVKSAANDHQLVTIADDPAGSDFHVPAHFQRGRLSIAVSTGGASPTLANKICTELGQQFDDSYEEYLEFLFSTRQWIINEVEDSLLKRTLLTAIVSTEFLSSEHRAADFIRLYESSVKKG